MCASWFSHFMWTSLVTFFLFPWKSVYIVVIIPPPYSLLLISSQWDVNLYASSNQLYVGCLVGLQACTKAVSVAATSGTLELTWSSHATRDMPHPRSCLLSFPSKTSPSLHPSTWTYSTWFRRLGIATTVCQRCSTWIGPTSRTATLTSYTIAPFLTTRVCESSTSS
jgi:hypothetical protein